MKKKKMTTPRSWADMPVSLRIVGARIPRTPRSTNDSHEQRAMPTQGTHMRQPDARVVDVWPVATRVVDEDIGLLWSRERESYHDDELLQGWGGLRQLALSPAELLPGGTGTSRRLPFAVALAAGP